MGYTHYFYQPKNTLDKEKWANMILDFYKILPNYMDYLDNDPDSSQCLKANTEEILFNGIGEDSHETFLFERKPDLSYTSEEGEKVFNFCKTARKPYDIVVCITMLIIKKHFPDIITISSDGGESEWEESVQVVNNKLGYNIENPFSE